MGFTRLLYQSGDLGVVNIEVADDTSMLVGTAPTGPAVSSLTVYASGSRNRNGVHARGVVATRERGTAPDTFTESRFVPVLQQSELDSASFSPGSTLTIGSNTFTIQRRVPEIVR